MDEKLSFHLREDTLSAETTGESAEFTPPSGTAPKEPEGSGVVLSQSKKHRRY